MVIFHRFVSLPEGNGLFIDSNININGISIYGILILMGYDTLIGITWYNNS